MSVILTSADHFIRTAPGAGAAMIMGEGMIITPGHGVGLKLAR